MTPRTRKPGRPRGSSRHATTDRLLLDKVADLMAREPTLKKCRAISIVVQKHVSETYWAAAERRLQRKWNRTATERQAEADERRRERHVPHPAPAPHGGTEAAAGALASLAALDPGSAVRRAMAAAQPYSSMIEQLAANSAAHALAERLNLPAIDEAMRRVEGAAGLMEASQPMLRRLESLAGYMGSPEFQRAVEQAQGVLGSAAMRQAVEQINHLDLHPPQRSGSLTPAFGPSSR